MNRSILARGSGLPLLLTFGCAVEADYFKLHVNLRAALFGPITVEAASPAVGCEDDHDHEEQL